MNTFEDIKAAISQTYQLIDPFDEYILITTFYFYMGIIAYASVLMHITLEEEQQLKEYCLTTLGLEHELPTSPTPKLKLVVDNNEKETT